MPRADTTIEIHGLDRDRALRARIRTQIATAIARVGPRPVSAHVAFDDQNGPKGGPAIRCALTVRLPDRRAVRVEEMAVTRRLAFDGGFDALERRLARYRGQDRENRRHPKKYYAAKLLAEGAPSSAPRRRKSAPDHPQPA